MEECGAAGDESTGVGDKEVREIQIAFVIKKKSNLLSDLGSKCMSNRCQMMMSILRLNTNMASKGLTNVCPIAEKRGQFPCHTYLQKVYGLLLVEFVQLLIKYYTEQSQ